MKVPMFYYYNENYPAAVISCIYIPETDRLLVTENAVWPATLVAGPF